LLLRSALTQEFLGLPARMEAVEKRLESVEDRLTRLEEAVAQLVETVRQLAIDIGYLRGVALETKLHRSVRSRVSQALGLRRARIMQSELLEPLPELVERMDAALASGLITDDQDSWVEATDSYCGRNAKTVRSGSGLPLKHPAASTSVTFSGPGRAPTFWPSCLKSRLKRRLSGIASATWTPSALAPPVSTS
jgi:tetrahydromethanopterin S-methyltransferase subunit G